MKTQVEIKGIIYNVLAEETISGFKNIEKNNNGNLATVLLLVRPNGNKEFWATRDNKGIVTLN
jgi:hypothetical protein